MNEQQNLSPRQRMQELLAIPDSDRTDAEWDELNELEISLAPGNRIGAPVPGTGAQMPRRRPGKLGTSKSGKSYAPQGKTAQGMPPRAASGENAGNNGAKRTGRKFFKRSPKPKSTPGTPQE